MTAESPDKFKFDELSTADLIVDAIYEGGTAKNVKDDPIAQTLKVGNSGGIRYLGGVETPRIVALVSDGRNPDWPDSLNPESGLYTYYGDNRQPGKMLMDTPRRGNQLLTASFANAHSAEARHLVAPFFIFEKTGHGRNHRFLGCAVPGSPDMEASEDLVAIWRSTNGQRFQNYRAHLTVLDAAVIPRAWIKDLEGGNALSVNCPKAFRRWVESGTYEVMRAPRTITHRTREQQIPTNTEELEMLQMIHQRFAVAPSEFEACAAVLWRMLQGPAIQISEVTRKSVDGGRDATGTLTIGPDLDTIRLDFALEAKCYAPGQNGSGVKDVARLISRLRHRQFGVFVTTSYVASQAYREIRDDEHPVVIMSGIDIIQTLQTHGVATKEALAVWLTQDFREAAAAH